jgi:hypothetical protein
VSHINAHRSQSSDLSTDDLSLFYHNKSEAASHCEANYVLSAAKAERRFSRSLMAAKILIPCFYHVQDVLRDQNSGGVR